MFSPRRLACLALSFAALARAALPDARMHAPMMRRPSVPQVTADDSVARQDPSGAALPPLSTVYLFDQLIDHNNPGLGTFQQRFWTTWEFYEPGTSSPDCTLS